MKYRVTTRKAPAMNEPEQKVTEQAPKMEETPKKKNKTGR